MTGYQHPKPPGYETYTLPIMTEQRVLTFGMGGVGAVVALIYNSLEMLKSLARFVQDTNTLLKMVIRYRHSPMENTKIQSQAFGKKC